jgi:hypothetical protein
MTKIVYGFFSDGFTLFQASLFLDELQRHLENGNLVFTREGDFICMQPCSIGMLNQLHLDKGDLLGVDFSTFVPFDVFLKVIVPVLQRYIPNNSHPRWKEFEEYQRDIERKVNDE